MTKSQLIEAIAGRMPSVPARQVEAVVNDMFEGMMRALCRSERIEIRGFGSFSVRVRAPKRGRNPKTGEQVDVPRRKTPLFIAGKDLKERLNRPLGEST